MKTIWGSWVLASLCGALAMPACSSDNGAGSGGGAAGATGGSSGASGTAGTSGAGGASVDSGSAMDAGTTSDAAPCAATDLRGRLLCIPGLTIVQDVAAPDAGTNAGYRRFDMTLDQLVDHDNPNGQHFQQQLTLLHRDETAPMVLASTGYNISRGQNELSRTFAANIIQVEHRYFAPSIPSPTDWTYLNIKQSAGDYHAITMAFKTIYKGKWVNTGASKGGMTSVYFRRFYPNDLDATVAYVAPNSFGLADARYPEFLRQVGGDTYAACRDGLKELQKTVLTRRAEIETRMTDTYNSLGGPDIALEHATLEMPFTFWQYQAPTSTSLGCSAIPAPDAPLATLFSFFNTVSYLSNFSDTGFDTYTPYYYQATNQLGAPGVDDAHLVGLLQHRETYYPGYYIPKGIDVPTWDAEAMVDVQNWVKTEAKTMMFIYGEFDPWSAGRYEIGTSGDNYRFIAPGSNHGSNLARLSSTDRAQALSILQGWLGVPPVMPLDMPSAFDDATFRPRL